MKAFSMPATRWERAVVAFWLVAWLWLVYLIVYAAIDVDRRWLFVHDPVAASRDLLHHDRIDIPLILNSLARKPTFASTFAWWHSSWVPEVPFWRPLTIQTFWLEKHLFGIDRFDRWMWVSFAAHLASIGAFAWFIYSLTGVGETKASVNRRMAITWLTLAIYAAARLTPYAPVFFSDLFGITPAAVALDAWKNQPDMFADTFVFLALALALHRRYVPAMVSAFVAVAFKESGWMAWVMAAGVLTIRGDWKRIPARTYVVAGMIVFTLLAFRFLSGPDVFFGYHQGSNRSWWTRYEAAVGACYLMALYQEPYCFILGHALFVFTWLRTRHRALLAYAVLTLAGAAALALQMHLCRDKLDVVLVSYFDPTTLNYRGLLVFGIYLMLSGFAIIMADRYYRPLWLFAMAGVLLTALPFAAASQVQTHALHQAYAFESLTWALIFWAVLERLWSNAARRPPSMTDANRPEAASASPAG